MPGYPIRHKIFVHRRRVGVPIDFRGTNLIESFWKELKSKLMRQYCSHGNETSVEDLIMEAAWKV